MHLGRICAAADLDMNGLLHGVDEFIGPLERSETWINLHRAFVVLLVGALVLRVGGKVTVFIFDFARVRENTLQLDHWLYVPLV